MLYFYFFFFYNFSELFLRFDFCLILICYNFLVYFVVTLILLLANVDLLLEEFP